MPVMKLAFLFLFLSLSVQAQSLKAQALSSEWLNLLHMRRTWTGAFDSSVRGTGFFLSPQGAQDPQAELQETFRQMFASDEATEQKAQCQFLARRDFLLRQDPGLQNKIRRCQFSQDWLEKLNTTKISLIFASGYMNSAASSFGHTFLKLQNPKNQGGKELLDYGINFAARTEETRGALYALYGLLGYFPGAFSMLPYHQMIKDYTHLEGRDLWEYELDFKPEEVQRVLYHLLELDRSYFDYYFLDDNCSFELLKVLEVGRPGLQLAESDEFFVIPLDTVKVIQPLVNKISFRPSLETEWEQRKSKLKAEQIQALQDLNPKTKPEQLQHMDTETLSAALYLSALKEIENHDQWKNINYEISKEKAKRGPSAETFQIQRPEESPDQGPHSSAIELGFLDQQGSYLLSGFHFAFHDQLSRNVGVSPFSHLEVLGFQWQGSDLKRYRLLDTLSTKAIDGFEKPISWGVSLGADAEVGPSKRLQHEITGRFGYSFDLSKDTIRWTTLLVGGLRQDLDHQFQFTPGLDSRLWVLWQPGIRSFVQYEYARFPSFNFQKVSGFQVFDLKPQLELRLGWQSQKEDEFQKIEKSISFVQNFLM